MLHRVLMCLLLGGMALAQTAKPAAPKADNPASKSATTPAAPKAASPAVITINGVCKQASAPKASDATGTKPAANCKTVVTQSEFEAAVNALQPTMPAAQRKQFAERYAIAVALAEKAQALGLDKGPSYEENLKLARLQVLARAASDAMQKQATQIDDKEISDYYNKNIVAYEEADLLRLVVPKTKKVEPPKEGASQQPPADPPSMEKEANDLHARAVAGEDFTKLQSEAADAAGMKGNAPNVALGNIRRTMLPVNQVAVLDLKPGDVSEVLSDPSGYYIYKLKSKDTAPLDKVRDEIRSALQNQRMQDSMGALRQAVVLDDNYFKAPEAPMPQGMPAPQGVPQGSAPPAPAPKQ
jgi:bifunctional DNA-binding transcriptional regulator/antitoxin component of YhaV-PrlF toxin-antitoxin module